MGGSRLAWLNVVTTKCCEPAERVARTRRVVARTLHGPQSVAAARQLTTASFRRWGLEKQGDSAALVVSELAGNAFRHGRQPVRLVLCATGAAGFRTAFCAVTNAGQWRKDRQDEDLAEWGRGLYIVRAVADSLMVRHDRLTGRTVALARFVVKPDEDSL